ncbi:MAG TPA: PASTA domain-containing protein [Candidatus Krumholzibacteria bacterium]|nr:PASTA domain-containing protein [Candidatus Krumholzibacteria bacterium]HRX50296.1 PASTA domain-containing protein [Candidatus Krumholzibacteria bacterium]
MKIWQFLLLLAALGVVFVLGVLSFNFLLMPRLVHRNPEVRVPDLAGLPLERAREAAQAEGLAVETVRAESHPSIPAGGVIHQAPRAGAVIRAGRRVAVVLSDGHAAGPVPRLQGLSRRQAEATLQRESFRVGRVLEMRDPGAVAASVGLQSPAAGTPLAKGESVDMVVVAPVSGRALLMPDLRGRSLFSARAAAEAAGCVLSPVRYERDGRVPANTVLKQRPDPGSRVAKGGTVELVASTR